MNEQWQLIGPDQWVFGTMIRGIVRKVRAEIYFDEDSKSPIGGWIWFTHGEVPLQSQPPRGMAPNRLAAIAAVERALGIE